MKLRNFSPIVISLLVGAALGYCLGPLSSPAPTPEPEQKAEPGQAKHPDRRDHGDRAANRALRARIKELEDMLAKQGVEVEEMKEESSRRERRDRPRDFRADMERLKKEEPERYAQITNSMAQFRRHRLERAQSKIDFLSSIDTSRMSPAMLKVHSDLQDMIEKREAVEEKMRGFMDMTEEERREAFQEIGEIDGRIRELNRAERDNLLVQTAEALGFQGDDAAEIIDTVKSIYEATDSGWGFGGPGGPGRRGGRGGRGGPGGRGGNR
jgi:septal ring factor EnvC (AmiA/AmiB activator)